MSPTPVRRVILVAEPMTSVDVTSSAMVARLDACPRQNGIELRFAEMRHPVTDELRCFEPLDQFGEQSFDSSLEAAVDADLAEHIGTET